MQRRTTYPTPALTPVGQIARVASRALLYGKYAQSGYRAARRIQRAYRKYRANRAAQVSANAISGWSQAGYHGRFKGKFKKGGGVLQKYAKNGFLVNHEVFGNVADPDIVYITHNTYSYDKISRVIALALLRKLLKKVGINPDSGDQELPVAAYNDAGGFKLEYVVIDNAGTPTVTSYITANNDTMELILSPAKWALQDTIKSMLRANVDGQQLDRLIIYTSDGGVWRSKYELQMQREVMEIYISSNLNIQNRTKAASGDVTSTEVIDNQPLMGFIYNLKGAVPKVQSMGVNGLTQVADGGVSTTTGASLGTALKEPPLKSYFTNCTGVKPVKLEPGGIKNTFCSVKYRGFFNNLIQKLRVQGGAGAFVTARYAQGKCQIIALEEQLNSGSLNNITVMYEAQKKIGCMFITTKKASALGAYYVN